jgi:hypothetical protein
LTICSKNHLIKRREYNQDFIQETETKYLPLNLNKQVLFSKKSNEEIIKESEIKRGLFSEVRTKTQRKLNLKNGKKKLNLKKEKNAKSQIFSPPFSIFRFSLKNIK